MPDIKYKDLTVDNMFDFCDVLAAVGVDEIISSFDAKEVATMQKSGKDAKGVGTVMVAKIFGVIVKNLGKSRNEVCRFFANCIEWDNGSAVTVDDVKKFSPSSLIKMIKDFSKKEDLADFFKEAAELMGMDQSDSKS